MGSQMKIVAMIPAIHQLTTIPPRTRTVMRKAGVVNRWWRSSRKEILVNARADDSTKDDAKNTYTLISTVVSQANKRWLKYLLEADDLIYISQRLKMVTETEFGSCASC